ncbi:MAG: SAM-dependent chlorinase/fluorinase [Nitrososphaerota archaeon]
MRYPIVALLTDYGTGDSYVSEVKAVILGYTRQVHLVDITHEVESYNELEAAFILSCSSKTFPADTIFICIVDPTVGSSRPAIVIETRSGKTFIGPDTGIMVPAAERDGIIKVRKIDFGALGREISGTFHGRDVFAHVAGMLIAGWGMRSILKPAEEFHKLYLPRPVTRAGEIEATVLHVDRFGNVITNMEKSDIPAGVASYKVRSDSVSLGDVPLKGYYSSVGLGEPVLVMGGTGYLEVSVNRGSAAKLLGVRSGDKLLFRY